MDEFEQWMQQQFPEGEPEPAREESLAGEFMELLERHNLSHQAILLVFERLMPVFRAMGRMRTLANRFEAQGMARPGFRQALEALVVHHITIDTRDATEETVSETWRDGICGDYASPAVWGCS